MMHQQFQRGHLGPPERQKILGDIGTLVVGEAPEEWTRIVYTMKMVAGHGSDQVVVEFPDGARQREFAPVRIIPMVKELRAGMYLEGKGTWFSMEYVITRPGNYNVHFNYDQDPGITFPTPQGYTQDLKYFPRDEEHIPDWLRERLRAEAEGQVGTPPADGD
ncbi:hypothetical protein NI17_017485 [Thermobifida halotolerans]|uniref:Uncharacterized protein n=1 Tax=Thermobifida halotolerans TaxID=483545 RepID=A0A399G441_9ACTN|nr:hypothetical protein [Thermobifida halotolerans]UOE18594.1 hypothetical protein NI17_017485 [Thermobifida halotolerans]